MMRAEEGPSQPHYECDIVRTVDVSGTAKVKKVRRSAMANIYPAASSKQSEDRLGRGDFLPENMSKELEQMNSLKYVQRCPDCHIRLWSQKEKDSHRCPGPAQRGAYFKGMRAYLEFGKDAKCPYSDLRTDYHNGVTYSAGFIKWWRLGLQDAEREEEFLE